MSVVPFVFYSWLMFVFGIIFIIIGFPKTKDTAGTAKKEEKKDDVA